MTRAQGNAVNWSLGICLFFQVYLLGGDLDAYFKLRLATSRQKVAWSAGQPAE